MPSAQECQVQCLLHKPGEGMLLAYIHHVMQCCALDKKLHLMLSPFKALLLEAFFDLVEARDAHASNGGFYIFSHRGRCFIGLLTLLWKE